MSSVIYTEKIMRINSKNIKDIILISTLAGVGLLNQGAFADKTYTLDADFDSGNLVNLNHDPNHDQLQLNKTATPFPFVNIAASARQG